MELIGNSSLWVEKYRPQTVKDLILPETVKNYFFKLVEEQEIPNILLAGRAGLGKTSIAFALCNVLKADKLYINASIENSIDVVRYKVQQFAMTSSFSDGKKIVILDELDRMQAGQDALKALIEQTESNCRFIIITNNLAKIIEPIKSRTHYIDFNWQKKEQQALMLSYFKRICWILDQENVKYDKKVLAEYVQKMYPDFRKTLNELQKFVQMQGEVSDKIFNSMDDSQFNSLTTELKNKKFNNVRKIATDLDPDQFYMTFYREIDLLLVDSCKADIILLLAQYSYESALTVNKEITLTAALVQIMRTAIWK
jgi:DNA polymerase III delta prime subunit